MDKKPEKLVPEVRFKGFTDDWEQRKFLDEIDSIIDYRGKTPKKLGMSWSKTGYLALSALNVKNGWIDKESNDSHFGNQALYDIWMKSTPLYKGQVVFTTEAPMGNVAQIPDNEKYILSQRTIAFNPSQRLIDGFLADLLSTKKIQNELMSLATGGTAKGVSQKSLKFLKIAFPNTEEQNFIHKVIKLLQTFITLQQRKLRQLKQLKKAMLQQLFTDKNSKQPNLRFKNFRGDWEQRKLKSVVSVNSGKDYKSLEKGNVPVYGTGGYITSVSKFLSSQDAIGLGRKGTINKPYILKAPFWTVDTLFYLTLKPENILTFIYSLIQKINWLQYDESTGLPSLSKKNIENVLVSLTKLDEQQKIGKVIVKLDKFITLQQSKIDQLTILKKYLLQKLFI